MAGYWIAHVNVSDAESYGKYAELAKAAVLKHGGEFIARGGRVVWLEGEPRARNVVVRFSSVEAAEACYHSEDYQTAMEFSKDACDRDLCIIEGD